MIFHISSNEQPNLLQWFFTSPAMSNHIYFNDFSHLQQWATVSILYQCSIISPSMSHFICSYWTTSSTSNEPSNLHQWEATYISENWAITSPPMSHYISEAPSLLKQWASTASLSQPSHLHVAMSHLIKNYTLSIMLYSSKFFVFFSNCFTTILVYIEAKYCSSYFPTAMAGSCQNAGFHILPLCACVCALLSIEKCTTL